MITLKCNTSKTSRIEVFPKSNHSVRYCFLNTASSHPFEWVVDDSESSPDGATGDGGLVEVSHDFYSLVAGGIALHPSLGTVHLWCLRGVVAQLVCSHFHQVVCDVCKRKTTFKSNLGETRLIV